MKKKPFIISAVILILIGVVSLVYGTLAVNDFGNGEVYYFNLGEGGTTVTVEANSYKTVFYKIRNTNSGTVKYGISYTNQDNIEVLVYNDSPDEVTGTIMESEYKFIKLRIINNRSSSQSTTLGAVLGYENGGDLVVPNGKSLVNRIYE